RIDGTGHKVGREHRRMPTGEDADGEVETYDCMDGNNQWRSEAGKQYVKRFIVVPMPRRSPPSHCEDCIERTSEPIPGAIPHRRKIRNQSDEPKYERDREIRTD